MCCVCVGGGWGVGGSTFIFNAFLFASLVSKAIPKLGQLLKIRIWSNPKAKNSVSSERKEFGQLLKVRI